jgi:hypothetical protein
LLPGIQTGVLPENGGEQLQLKKELAGLGLPVVKGAVTSSLAGKYDDKKWTFVPNELHVQTMQFAFSNKGCRLTVSAGAAPSVLEFGWEKWTTNAQREPYIFNPGEMVPMPSKRAGTATWINDHTLQLNVRFVEAIFGDAITCVFEGEQVTVSFLNSVAETALKKTPDPRKPLSGTMG